LRPSLIQGELKAQSIYIKDVYVEKKLPNTLEVRVTERIPEFIVVNLTGSYLIDTEGTIIDWHKEFSDHGLSESDIYTLRGYQTIEKNPASSSSTSTDNMVDAEITQEEQEAIEAAQLEENRELRTRLEADQQLVVSKVRAFWREMIDDNDSFYHNYTLIYSYQETSYTLGSEINQTVHLATREVISADWEYLHPSLYTWESEVKLSVLTAEGTKVFFSMNEENPRDIFAQLEDLKVVLSEGRFHGREYVLIDLGSDKILYTQK
jgi:hypothetical protein